MPDVGSVTTNNTVKNYLDKSSSNTSNTSDNSKTISEQVKAGTSVKTGRGTRIVKPGQDMDRNSFLRILSAELSNQDPNNTKDSTAYVSQMAQFAGLEQSANLNQTMRLAGATSLIGKYATINTVDPKTGQLYSGEIIDTTKDGSDVKLSVVVGTHVDANGKTVEDIKQFNMDNLSTVENMIDTSKLPDLTSYILNSPALLGKQVSLTDKDESGNNYSGVVKEIFRDEQGMKVKVQVDSSTTKDFLIQNVQKIS